MTTRERILLARIADLREVKTTLTIRMESADAELDELEDRLAALRHKGVIKIEATEPIFGFSIGEVELNTHGLESCSGTFCVVHRPSEHHMRTWPLLWRADRRLMERTCEHGVGHPDPDDLAYHVRNGRSYQGVHGCDGCCRP